MPDAIVIDTSPLISLVAAIGDLNFLASLYEKILVPFEVCQEIESGGRYGFAVSEFKSASFLQRQNQPLDISVFLSNSLDRGEAAVIQLALNENIKTVCIDEAIGRRFARINGLALTGSIGILIRAKKEGIVFSMRTAIDRMRQQGIWLSEQVIGFALSQAGENSL